MDSVIDALLEAVEREDCAEVTILLHPFLLWIEAEQAIRGRNTVLTRLAAGPAPRRPAFHEMRDGQIYRWQS